jgi:hypothetical protein
MDSNVFVFSFCQNGFEAIVNLTEIDQQDLLNVLADSNKKSNVNSILNMMLLRAKFNENRCMEVWLVKLDSSFTEESLLKWADEDPQAVANFARLGEPVYTPGSPRKVIT